MRNIKADPRVRVRVRGRRHTGTAHLMPDDAPVARLRSLPRLDSAAVRAIGAEPLTVRVDLDGRGRTCVESVAARRSPCDRCPGG
ncbi:protein of unknown function [Streptomyces sp. di188]|nr:protein of unknown function [Streptomyces sp. di188]SCD57149.1 protein of unknown function [Streptomyces sp. di50b]